MKKAQLILIGFLLLMFALLGGSVYFIVKQSSDSVENVTSQEAQKDKTIVKEIKVLNVVNSDNKKEQNSKEVLENVEKRIIGDSKSLEKLNDIKINSETKEIIANPVKIKNETVKLNEISNVENTDTEKSTLNKSIYFLDENGNKLFSGQLISVKAQLISLDQSTILNISNNSGEWKIIFESDLYYIADNTKNIINEYKNNFRWEELPETIPIILSKFSNIIIKINSKADDIKLPDDMSCVLYSLTGFSCQGKIKNNKAIFHSKRSGVVTVSSFTASKVYSKFNKEISLTAGQTIEFDLDVVKGIDQSYQLLDVSGKPIANHVVVVSRGALASWEVTRYYNNLVIGNDDFFHILYSTSDEKGMLKFGILEAGNYFFTVLGKSYVQENIKCAVTESEPIIKIQLRDEAQIKLTLNVMLNNKPFTDNLEFTYYDLNGDREYQRPLLGKFVSGTAMLTNLKPSKYNIQLKSNDYFREKYTVDLMSSKEVEHTFELKPSENFIHGYIKTPDGKPLSVKLVFYENNINYEIFSDKNGYYKFGGLDLNLRYGFCVEDKYPNPEGIPQKITPSNEEINITVQEMVLFSGEVFGLDGKPAESFTVHIKCYKDKDLKKYLTYRLQSFTQGKFKLEIANYGYYDLTIKLPDAPFIHKVIPVLSPETNLPVSLYAVPGFSISGQINDFENKPVSGVTVTRQLYHTPLISKSEIVGEITKSDSNGMVKLDNCLVGETYWLVKVGYIPLSYTVKEEDKNSPFKASFQKSYKIKGSILNSEKKSMGRIQIVGHLDNRRQYMLVLYSDENGNFTIDPISPGNWYIFFNVSLPQGQKPPGQWVKIVDKDEELNFVYEPKK